MKYRNAAALLACALAFALGAAVGDSDVACRLPLVKFVYTFGGR